MIVAVKAPALPEVAATIGPLLRDDTPVMFVMNGIPWWYFYAHGGALDGRRLPLIDPGDVVWNAVGPQRAIGSVIYSSNTVVGPGIIRNTSGRVHLIIGEPTGQKTPRIKAIADAVNISGAKCDISERIRDDIWTKLLANMSSNPLTFLAQCSLGAVFAEPVCVAAVKTMAAGSRRDRPRARLRRAPRCRQRFRRRLAAQAEHRSGPRTRPAARARRHVHGAG